MNKISRIHSIYILFILISIIILLISVNWVRIPKLVELVSFALTISSLVLAILAIGYAVYSNSSFAKFISKLENSSEKINDSSKDLASTSQLLLEKIDKIPTILNTIQKKTDDTHILVSNLNTIPIESNVYKGNEIDLENFVYKNSTYGQFCLYLIYLSYINKKQFNLKLICEEADLAHDFMDGFLSCCSTIKIINAKSNISRKDDSKEFIFNYQILDIHKFLEINIPKMIESLKVEKQKVIIDDKIIVKELNITTIKKMESYFVK